MIRSHILAACLVLGSLAGAASAATTTIDFESFNRLDDVTNLDLGGVSLSRGSSALRVVGIAPNSIPSLIGDNQVQPDNLTPAAAPFRADFTDPSATVTDFTVGIVAPRFANTELSITVTAFDARDVELDQTTFVRDFGFDTAGINYREFTVSSPGDIDYATFSVFAAGSNFQGAIFDNVSFTTSSGGGVAPIPLPVGMLTLPAAVLALTRVARLHRRT